MNRPKYVAIAAMTLDGKIAQNSHQFSYDWTSKEDKKFFQAELKKLDAVLVGSNTFKMAREPLLKRNTLVLTSKIKNIKEKYPHVWFVNYKTVDLNSFIKKLGYKKIAVIGGSKVYAYALEKNLIDEMYLTLEPLAFGKGINLFAGTKSNTYKFKLVSVKKINRQGTLLLYYSK